MPWTRWPTAASRGLTADEVQAVVFPKPGRGQGRGYDEDEVDTLLDAVEATLRGGSGVRGVPELNGRPLPE
ncbi:MAG TPA: DivIVA domain-containing protein [Blastococcus sp.]|jgi:DivIVA domain-containing protein|nr:DivIVA domain-containing protein [Blastococcus sp.]